MPLAFKILVLSLLGLIVLSLTSGVFFMSRDNKGGKRLVTALTFRIGLSIALFALLIIGYFAGWIHPHGVQPMQ